MSRARSPVGNRYDAVINRESAHEVLRARKEGEVHRENPSVNPPPQPASEEGGFGQTVKDWMFGTKRRQGALEAATKSAARTAGTQITRSIMRGILGGMRR